MESLGAGLKTYLVLYQHQELGEIRLTASPASGSGRATTHVFLCGAALSCCPWEGMLVPRAGGGAPVPLLQSGVPGESPGEGDPSSLLRDLGAR